MPAKRLTDGHHLSLAIGKALWDDLISAALPVKVSDGEFDLGRMTYRGLKQLQVKEKALALIEDRHPPAMVVRARDRAAIAWRNRRERVYKLIDEMVHVQGAWRIEVDREGTEFHYAPQRFGVDAHVKMVATGTAWLLRENVALPFEIEKRLGASCSLAEIRYDKNKEAVVGDIADPQVDFGDTVVFRLLNRAGAWLLEQQTPKFNPVPILKKEQVESLFGPAGGPLKIHLGVEDMAIEVSEADVTLRVRFGFTQKQLAAESR